MKCRIEALTIYPIKGCRGQSLSEARCSPLGLEGDRQFIITRTGRYIAQKEKPELAQIAPSWEADGSLKLTHQSLGDFSLTPSQGGATRKIELVMDQVSVVDQGDEVAAWLSEAVGEPVRLQGLASSFRRNLPVELLSGLDGLEQSGFMDVSPLLLTNAASLDDLNKRLEDPVPMDRFRNNIAISGPDAWAEDEIQSYLFEGGRLIRAASCERCAVTATDQLSGERGREPLRTLRGFRKTNENCYASGIIFGAYVTVSGDAVLKVGGELSIAW